MTDPGKAGPVRRCIACRQPYPKGDLLRLVADDSGAVWPDLKQQAQGRGAYLCLRPECLSRITDRRLGGLVKSLGARQVRWNELRARILERLDEAIARHLRRWRTAVRPGRDAVMRRIWNNAPLVILLATDAGEALKRQVREALDRRAAENAAWELIELPSGQDLARWLEREKLSVLALDDGPEHSRLKRYCIWYGCIKGTG